MIALALRRKRDGAFLGQNALFTVHGFEGYHFCCGVSQLRKPFQLEACDATSFPLFTVEFPDHSVNRQLLCRKIEHKKIFPSIS